MLKRWYQVSKGENLILKEIEVIQGIIKRMAYNSLAIKTWTVILVVVALLTREAKVQTFAVFVPLIVLWFLDAYYLWQERMYRKLYNWVIRNRWNTDEYLFDMNAYRFRAEIQSPLRIMFSLTLGWFYGSIAVLVLVYCVSLILW